MDKSLYVRPKSHPQSACQDELTGLFNQDFFQLTLDREIELSRRYGSPFVLALLDIDNFRGYNEKYGRTAGDNLLKGIGNILKHCGIRQSDLATRISADRFALLLVEITLPVAKKVLSRLQQEIMESLGNDVTLSMSVVSFPGNASTKENLFFIAEDFFSRTKALRNPQVSGFNNHSLDLSKKESAQILLIDDEPINIELLSNLLINDGYQVLHANNAKEALQLVAREDIDLILLDIILPDMDGYEVCALLKQAEATRMIPVILVTSLNSIKSKIKGIECGADDFITKPPDPDEILARIHSLIHLKNLNNNLTSIENVLMSLANIIEAKDSYTEGHIQRVASIALEIGKQFGMQKEELESLKLGGILHDIGKIGIPGEILNKTTPLTADEWIIMKKHVQIGYNICLPLQKNLGSALEIIRHHHERLDGSGYPDGLYGDQISLAVRIMAVVDTYDALTTKRSYRKAISPSESLKIVEQYALDGTLDPEVVKQLKYYIIRQEMIENKQEMLCAS